MSDLFDYRAGWRPDQRRQGDHMASISGNGGAYRGDRPLRDAGDARHLSLRASLRDPFEQLWVRDYLHSATLDVWIFADLSLSMRGTTAAGASNPLQTVARFVRSAAFSTRSVGDRLGVFCAAGKPLWPHCIPPSRQLAPALALSDRLGSLTAESKKPDSGDYGGSEALSSAAGLWEGVARVGSRQSLVFLLSDFNDERCDWSGLLKGLSHHQVVPVVTWDLPAALVHGRNGLISLRDAETGRERVLWMRGALREKIGARLDEQFTALERLFSVNGRRAIHLFEGYDATAVTRFFHGDRHRDGLPSKRVTK